MNAQIQQFMTYIWAREISRQYYDADLDPGVTDNDITNKFNSLNLYCKNFNYQEILNLVFQINKNI